MGFPLDKHRKFYNTNILKTLQEGDLVEFPRGLYSHWGVYVGESKIVHLSKVADTSGSSLSFKWFTKKFNNGCVKLEYFLDVVGNSFAKKNNDKYKTFHDNIVILYLRSFSPADIKVLALSKLGPRYYNVFCNNCEHFATWCRYGLDLSQQVDTLLTLLVIVVALVLNVIFKIGNKKKK